MTKKKHHEMPDEPANLEVGRDDNGVREDEKDQSYNFVRDDDTQPPPPEFHGFIEQFERLSASALADLKEVVELGLQPAERMILLKVSLKLLTLSMHGAQEEEFTPEMSLTISFLNSLHSQSTNPEH